MGMWPRGTGQHGGAMLLMLGIASPWTPKSRHSCCFFGGWALSASQDFPKAPLKLVISINRKYTMRVRPAFRAQGSGVRAWSLSGLPGSVTVSNSSSSHGRQPDRDTCLIKLLKVAGRPVSLYPQTSLDPFAKVETFIQRSHPLKGNTTHKKVKAEGNYFCVRIMYILIVNSIHIQRQRNVNKIIPIWLLVYSQ